MKFKITFEQKSFNRSISPINGTQTRSATAGHSGPGSNGNEKITPHLESYHKVEVTYIYKFVNGGARGVMVIVVGNEHGDMSSNPFHIALIPLEKV